MRLGIKKQTSLFFLRSPFAIFAIMKEENFSWKKRARSFKFAFAGIGRLVRCEHNARIHVAVTAGVLVAGFYFGLAAWEWAAVLLCIGGVLAAEAVNSAVEALADRITTERDEAIRYAKDYASGGVLLMVIAAVIVGLIVFLPKFYELFI